MTMISPNRFEELSATAAGETTSVLNIASAPGLENTGRFFGLIYVESTGGATGTVQVQVRPKGSTSIVGWIEALDQDIEITSSVTSYVADYVAMQGMECRGIVKTHSGTGTINIRVDLGIS